jgi:hypothetical protein
MNWQIPSAPYWTPPKPWRADPKHRTLFSFFILIFNRQFECREMIGKCLKCPLDCFSSSSSSSFSSSKSKAVHKHRGRARVRGRTECRSISAPSNSHMKHQNGIVGRATVPADTGRHGGRPYDSTRPKFLFRLDWPLFRPAAALV